VRGAAAAFLLVAVELVAGTFVLMWVSMLLWRSIDRGHFRAATWVLAPLTLVVALALPEGSRVAAFITAGLMAIFLACVYLERPVLEILSGGSASIASIAVVLSATLESCLPRCGFDLIQAPAGLLFLGAITHGMVLGHWYLNQPRLEIKPLKGATWIIFGVLALSAAVGVVTRAELLNAFVRTNLLAVSAEGYWWVWLLLLAGTFILTWMIRSTVAIRSTQSATGLLYIAMVPAIGAQFLLNLLAVS
jgi:hypothetical protein